MLTKELMTNARDWDRSNPWSECRANEIFSRVLARCISVCPNGYRDMSDTDKIRCVRDTKCSSSEYFSRFVRQCMKTPTCGVGQSFNRWSEQCEP